MNETGKSFNKDITNFFLSDYKGYQDPLFLTFLIQFDFIGNENNIENGGFYNYNLLKLNTNSVSWKKNDGTRYEQNDILRDDLFKSSFDNITYLSSYLSTINDFNPWFFTSVTGLEKALQYKENSAYRGGDDSIITIGCLENIDMQVSRLMQAYRDAVWDQNSWSWILHDNQRKFNVTIWATDFRRMIDSIERYWFQFNFSNCEFMLDSGNAIFSELSSSPSEQSTQSIVFKYENVNVKHGFRSQLNNSTESNYLKEKFGDLSDVEASSTSPDANIKDINENLFNLQSPNDRFLSKGWIDQKNAKITKNISRTVNNFYQDSKNKARDTARGLINEGISRVEEKIGNALGFDNFRANPSALANNVIKGLSDLSDRKSREALNSLLGTARNVEPLASDENVYGDIQQVLDEALDRKLQGYNNFIGQNPAGPGPLGPENVYDPE